MIMYHNAYIQLYVLGMITYHDQYIYLYKLSIITYHIFSERLIFLTQGLLSEYNCLIYPNIFLLYKAGYINLNTNSCFFIALSYSNSMLLLELRTLLLS